MKKKGKFVVIEGSHGTGKTTLANQLKKNLKKRGFSVSLTKEPFSDELSKLVTKYSETINPSVLQYLILADRELHVNFIQNVITNYDYVISERYVPSSLVYQRISKIPLKKIRQLNSDFPTPDLMLLLHCDLKTRAKRMRKNSPARKKDYFLSIKSLKLEQRYYSEICNKFKNKSQVCVINAKLNCETVLAESLEFISSR